MFLYQYLEKIASMLRKIRYHDNLPLILIECWPHRGKEALNHFMKQNSHDTCTFKIQQSTPGTLTVFLSKSLVIDTAGKCLEGLRREFSNHTFGQVVIDLSGIEHLDDYGVMAIAEIQSMTGLPADNIQLTGIRHEHRMIFDITNFEQNNHCRISPPPPPHFFVQTGELTISFYKDVIYFISFVGAVALSVIRIANHPRSLRWGDIVTHMKSTGVDAVPVVGLISMMLGLIIAFISSMQLMRYGANLYVANLVALAMVSELGPIMTGIVVAGRSGSAYAAEISTMKISEEIDALFVMGFDPNQFLVLPRLIAAFIVVPILTMFSNLFAIAGGMIIGMTMLDLSMDTYINQTLEAIKLFELSWGLFKSSVFAVLIAITGCLRGFQARGGAASVGNAATSAVVTSIFLIIFFDSMFAVIRIYWG
jgi:phospholipid/cholesterol/gamma-HCH transport system permease protein